MIKIFQFLRLTAKFLAVLRLTVNPIETLSLCISQTSRTPIPSWEFPPWAIDSLGNVNVNASLGN